MKKIVILLCIALITVSFPMFAEESVLIDFSTLAADAENGENAATTIDFSNQAGTGYTDAEKAKMKTSLSLKNWEVFLASSSRTPVNQSMSLTKEVAVKDSAKKYAGQKVLGVRVHFPTDPFNSWAIVRPPFEIPAYQPIDGNDREGKKFNGYGVVKNVGVLKSLSVNLLGMNFPNGFGVIIKDQNNVEKNIFIQHLNFDGWRELTWQNPNYIEDVRNRELKKYPLYPNAQPMIKLMGMIFYKDAAQEGGDFITYIKDIKITYDKAILSLDSDIDDEAVWGILQKREEARRKSEFEKLGNIQILRYLEQQKMHVEQAQQQ